MQKRSLKIAGHATSVALEPEFWKALENIADQRQLSLSALIATIDRQKEASLGRNLASQLQTLGQLTAAYNFAKYTYTGNAMPGARNRESFTLAIVDAKIFKINRFLICA